MGISIFKMDAIKLKLRGKVKISELVAGVEHEIQNSNNNILSTANEIICKRLLNLTSS